MYTEDDLRNAFYKGREQACLPDEKGTIMFIRPTFNGYLRELEGKENPYDNWKVRCENLIDNKDYDLHTWKTYDFLRSIQKNKINKSPNMVYTVIPYFSDGIEININEVKSFFNKESADEYKYKLKYNYTLIEKEIY